MEGHLTSSDALDSRQFLIAVRRLADSLSYGTDRSPFLGQGLEYVQSRRYQPGDPVKSIDWRVTARTGKAHVKQFETPKQIPVWLVVDTSASMAVSSKAPGKYGLAVQLAGGIALACLNRVSPVGVLGAGERDLLVRPSLSKDILLQWLHDLRRYSFSEKTRLGRTLVALEPSLGESSLVIVLSDFHDPEAFAALKLIASRHECIALVIQDPAERGLEGAGIFRGREAETGREFLSHGRKILSNRDRLAENFKKGGIDHFMIEVGVPFLAPLRHYLKARGGLGRRNR